jgi:hypothetical protein
MSTVVVAFDGVIRTDQGTPFQIGQMFYKVLVGGYRVVVASPLTVDQTEGYLKRNALLGWARIHEGTVLEALAAERVQSHVHFAITPDDDEARKIFEQGITVMLVGASDFVNPKWRPDRPSWGAMMKGVTHDLG